MNEKTAIETILLDEKYKYDGPSIDGGKYGWSTQDNSQYYKYPKEILQDKVKKVVDMIRDIFSIKYLFTFDEVKLLKKAIESYVSDNMYESIDAKLDMIIKLKEQ